MLLVIPALQMRKQSTEKLNEWSKFIQLLIGIKTVRLKNMLFLATHYIVLENIKL